MAMNRQRRSLLALGSALVLVVLLTACGGGASRSELGVIAWPGDGGQTGPQPGQRAPNFRLERVTGETVTLSDYLGQPVLLNFFASWCANCREEMAALDAASKQEVTVLGVNLRESPETVTRLAAETGASFPLLLDRKGAVTRAYRVSNLPVTFAIDASGTVRHVVLGPVDADRLDALICAARAGSGVEGETTR